VAEIVCERVGVSGSVRVRVCESVREFVFE
jgi:hypothetical protein